MRSRRSSWPQQLLRSVSSPRELYQASHRGSRRMSFCTDSLVSQVLQERLMVRRNVNQLGRCQSQTRKLHITEDGTQASSEVPVNMAVKEPYSRVIGHKPEDNVGEGIDGHSVLGYTCGGFSGTVGDTGDCRWSIVDGVCASVPRSLRHHIEVMSMEVQRVLTSIMVINDDVLQRRCEYKTRSEVRSICIALTTTSPWLIFIELTPQ